MLLSLLFSEAVSDSELSSVFSVSPPPLLFLPASLSMSLSLSEAVSEDDGAMFSDAVEALLTSLSSVSDAAESEAFPVALSLSLSLLLSVDDAEFSDDAVVELLSLLFSELTYLKMLDFHNHHLRRTQSVWPFQQPT